jgi:RNA methyltransferase, TrmH family
LVTDDKRVRQSFFFAIFADLGVFARTQSLFLSIDPFDPAVVRATMGSLFKQIIVRTSIDQLRHWVRMNNVQVIGASPDGSEDYREVSYTRPAVLMLGGERKGLTDEQRLMCQHMVRIPMVEGMDSLNVAVAGSLLMYEVFR